MTRKLASVQAVTAVNPIPGADAIEVADILGWHVVVKKGEFKPGDLCVYVEVDSVLPPEPQFEFLAKNKYRIRTVRLRGQVSQGIAFPLDILDGNSPSIGGDVTDILGITKFEPPVPASLSGIVRGKFPSLIPKTDEPRIQAFPQVFERYQHILYDFQATEKLDGSSCTAFMYEGELHVCSRNLDLKETVDNSFWQAARELDLESKLTGTTYAVQGELVGHGIQRNPLQIKGRRFYAFNVYDYQQARYLDAGEARSWLASNDIPTVPAIGEQPPSDSIDVLVDFATRKSTIGPGWAEGIVLRPKHEARDYDLGRLSFKVINPEYLLSTAA